MESHIPASIVFDPVLTAPAFKKLQSYNLLSREIDEWACWSIEPVDFYRAFPHVRFYGKKIPVAFNIPIFIVYLGFQPDPAVPIFTTVRERTEPTRSNIIAAVKDHVNAKWLASTHHGAAMGTPGAEAVMSEMGLIPEIRTEVNGLHLEFQRNAGIFQEYFNDNLGKNFENLQLVDFVHELVNQRKAKLEKLNDKVLLVLH